MRDFYPLILFIAGILFVSLLFLLSPPFAFPVNRSFAIAPGDNLMSVSQELAEQSIVRSPFLFRVFVRLLASEKMLIAGTYFWEQPLAAPAVAWRLTRGAFGIEPVKATLPEGVSVREIALILDKRLPKFDPDEFVLLAAPLEGYLFPDTYFFDPAAAAKTVVDKLRSNFNRRISTIGPQLLSSGVALRDVIIMASLLEKEAHQYDTKRLISGILWKRLIADVPLQVDAVFNYILGKNTFQLTRADLAVDSSYNTYKYTGLPEGPIANPGLESILAAVSPIDSPYWFYLSDREGNTHYARDFEEHKANKQKYLR